MAQTLGKDERIKSKQLTDQLFSGGGSKAMTVFPIRLVYKFGERLSADEPAAKILVSVPKRCFKRAVKRNRIKRLVREAYRRNKGVLVQDERMKDRNALLAFIWLDDKLRPYTEVEAAVIRLLNRLSERL